MLPDTTERVIVPNDPPRRHGALRDLIGVAVFVLAVIVGAFVLNAFVFQTYSVLGPSMQETLHTNDRLLVNKLPVSLSHAGGKAYLPARGEVVVFENPLFESQTSEEYLVKRVIGLPGERVVLKDGIITVYNRDNPRGFRPDDSLQGPKSPTSGNADLTVPANEIFVAGDNRIGEFSFDSRNGLGTVPLSFVQGPVAARIFPLSQFRLF